MMQELVSPLPMLGPRTTLAPSMPARPKFRPKTHPIAKTTTIVLKGMFVEAVNVDRSSTDVRPLQIVMKVRCARPKAVSALKRVKRMLIALNRLDVLTSACV